jgi:hypothetical protein
LSVVGSSKAVLRAVLECIIGEGKSKRAMEVLAAVVVEERRWAGKKGGRALYLYANSLLHYRRKVKELRSEAK